MGLVLGPEPKTIDLFNWASELWFIFTNLELTK